MKIIDNFLNDNDFKIVKDTFQVSNFPWYYTPFQVKPGDNSFMFCHLFVNNDKRHSQFTESMRPFLNKLNIKKLLRIKANLTTKKQEQIKGEMHTDFENCKTAIWYLNTNNGYTLFQDGNKVECIENRMVIFDSNKKHCGVESSDSEFRIVINFNYLEKF
tara:strand:+ start:553 stop:1032 length:480 start_codon:yes stop_codon:yes gene_type:complete